MGAGGGYSTELMARAVAPAGVVYGQNPADIGERAKTRSGTGAATAQTSVVTYFGVSCTRFPARRGIPQLLGGRYGLIKLFRAGPLFTAA